MTSEPAAAPRARDDDRVVDLDSRPRVPNAHLFKAGHEVMLLSPDSGGLYRLDASAARVLDGAMAYGDTSRVAHVLAATGVDAVPRTPAVPAAPVLHALSLAVAQKCNMGCTYCYAEQGGFGDEEQTMTIDVARTAVDRLLADAPPGRAVTLAYLGGEPLTNRPLIRDVTAYAAAQGAARGIPVTFSITTNGTLLGPQDAELFDAYGFTVTISIDGNRNAHDLLRPLKSGRGSYDRVIARARQLLDRRDRRCVVLARVTVTPSNMDLPGTLDTLAAAGFDGVQFAPVLHAPVGQGEMDGAQLDRMQTQLIACGQQFLDRLAHDEIHPFLNLIATLRRIHRGEPEAYPCGAGNGYLGVSATGQLYACHRFVNDDEALFGSVATAIDGERQQQWLAARHVDAQEPCRSCWARRMCSGGCHYEAMHRGRIACDYIRGWLHYCLGVYGTLRTERLHMLRRILALPEHQ